MKKTLTANISGTVFHIEEDAYDTLQRYLSRIRSRVTGTAGHDDIMADIEARIAELFTERLDGRRQVVQLADVDQVIAIMGQPEDFTEGGAEGPLPPPNMGTGRRRLYRDMDDKWVAGVLGGLGSYIGMDPLWLRIGMIALFLASVGSLIPIYILLWILVPKAETAAERLQMRGEAVTVDNIKRVVEEGTERMKQGGQRMAHEARDLGRQWGTGVQRGSGHVGRIIAKLVGMALLVLAFSLLLGLVTGMVGGTISLWHSTWTSQDTGILDLGELLFASRTQAIWFGIGVFLLLVVPIIGLFLSGFRLLLNTRSPRWLGITLVVVWIAAFIPTMWGTARLASEFKRENSVLTEIELQQPTDGLLYLDALAPADSTGDWSVRYDDGELDVDLEGLHLDGDQVFGGWASLGVERSTDSLFHLKVEREANGVTPKAARARAMNIRYNHQQHDDVLSVSPVIRYPAADGLRGQDVRFTLEVPVGKRIFLRPGSTDIIYDIKNVNNTYDDDMLGRTWTMTEKGLMDLSTTPMPPMDAPPAPLPPDSLRKTASPIAAVVWRAPAKRRPAPAHGTGRTSSTAGTPTQERAFVLAKANLVPTLFNLVYQRLR
ncbi:MAG: PspC domain-containing protein [Flavobacteriales bacterium]|jgi:phage shock protein PspC (stress-responsive transcriptional regulator)|nr:MAG: PspC domain-containing protein [Flavobacteriales bacterium]